MRKWLIPIWSTRNTAVALGTIVAVAFAGAPAARAAASLPETDARIVVTTSADAGRGSLRAALDTARTRPGADTIALATKRPIRLRTPLPAITDALTITGTGNEVFGPGAGAGFVVRSNDVTIKGVTLRNFTTGIEIERASRRHDHGESIRDNRGAGVAIVGPTKKEVAAALAAHTLSLPELVALVPTHVVVRDNRIGPNAGPAVARRQDGIVHVSGLTDDGRVTRGAVAHASGPTTVEVFASVACGAHPQAETRLGVATVSGKGAFSFAHASSVAAITVVAIDDVGGSSAVSTCARRVAPVCPARSGEASAEPLDDHRADRDLDEHAVDDDDDDSRARHRGRRRAPRCRCRRHVRSPRPPPRLPTARRPSTAPTSRACGRIHSTGTRSACPARRPLRASLPTSAWCRPAMHRSARSWWTGVSPSPAVS